MKPVFPTSVLITGATGAIGGALAQAYAGPGMTLILQGRNEDRLAELTAICEGRGARVLSYCFDIRDVVRLRDSVRAVEAQVPLDLVIANAGVNTNIGPSGTGELWEEVEALVDVNLRATLALVYAVLPAMRWRGRGQIALISSLAAYHGLPMTPSYCASKAAIKALGEALRGWLAAEGVRINVVMPGYVDSAMCRDMPGPKPFLWTAERAARVIRRGLAKDKARISFPFPLNLGTWLLSVIHPAVAQRILGWLNYHA
ncbi:MAG: SDR family NAD(P)-dependent oxidoreductase [Gammaproteobacteria bacterium]|nr:SDR family NAD(P)-dependent oxidoreductase [Gammaproteobacteria bacterium]MBU1654552.1 SDR family NAD(P)-dependent oxidoreductase [Gammaproteobacteria bacterium]MBU1961944.1 SDR family NAD(P)-dependent oxidoreductase [Gammaproteobacteria bacterium]